MKKMNILILTIFLAFASCINEKPIDIADEISVIENGLMGATQVRGEPINYYNIFDRMEHNNVPGVSIAIVENGEIRWAKGYGIANTNTGAEVNPGTLFQAGSISKPLAALAALKLEHSIDSELMLQHGISEEQTGYHRLGGALQGEFLKELLPNWKRKQ